MAENTGVFLENEIVFEEHAVRHALCVHGGNSLDLSAVRKFLDLPTAEECSAELILASAESECIGELNKRVPQSVAKKDATAWHKSDDDEIAKIKKYDALEKTDLTRIPPGADWVWMDCVRTVQSTSEQPPTYKKKSRVVADGSKQKGQESF